MRGFYMGPLANIAAIDDWLKDAKTEATDSIAIEVRREGDIDDALQRGLRDMKEINELIGAVARLRAFASKPPRPGALARAIARELRRPWGP